jgi:hypothetical protein
MRFAKKCRFDASLITAPPNIVWTAVPTVTAAFVDAIVALYSIKKAALTHKTVTLIVRVDYLLVFCCEA